jgi:hypothetical protein
MYRERPYKTAKKSADYSFAGVCIQGGYFVSGKIQAAVRYDFMDINSLNQKGMLNLPPV